MIKNLVLYKVSSVRNNSIIFKNISFTLNNGDILILQGPNGSGKSTLLNIIAGLHPKSSGFIYINNTVIDNLIDYNYFIHFISNRLSIKYHMTVKENLYYWTSLFNSNINIDNILKKFNLNTLINTYTEHLSLGQSKKLSLLKLFFKNKPIWLLDEPTIGLDVKSINILNHHIKEHQKLGGITIIATHSNLNVNNAMLLKL